MLRKVFGQQVVFNLRKFKHPNEGKPGLARFRRIATKVREKCQEEIQTSGRLAAYAVDDALNGRLAHGRLTTYKTGNKWAWFCLETHISPAWKWFVFFANALHTCLTFLGEPTTTYRPPPTPTPPHTLTLLFLVEVLCLAVYWADIYLKQRFMGWDAYWSKKWNRVHVFVCMVLQVDFVLGVVGAVLAHSILRMGRPFRFMIHVVRVREPRRVFSHVSDIQTPILKVLLSGLGVIVLFALPAVFLFRGHPAFVDFPTALLSLVVLSTFDNYGDIVAGASLPLHLFVVCFVMVGSIFLMSVCLDIAIKFYTDAEKSQLKSERKKELQGLTKAFSILDRHNTGRINFRAFKELIAVLRPGSSLFDACMLFDVCATRKDPHDKGGVAEIDAIDFLCIRKVLNIQFARRHIHNPKVTDMAISIRKFRPYRAALFICACVNLLVLSVRATYHLTTQPFPSDTEWFTWVVTNTSLLEGVHMACVGVIGVDMCVETLAHGWSGFLRREGSTLGAILVTQNVVIRGVFASLSLWYGLGGSAPTVEEAQVCAPSPSGGGGGDVCVADHAHVGVLPAVYGAVLVSDMLTAHLISTRISTLHRWMWSFAKMVPMLWDVSCFIFMNLFALAVVLVELGVFADPASGLQLSLKLLLGADWSGAMFDAVREQGPLIVTVFVLSFVLLQMVCFNLLVALVMNFEERVDDMRDENKLNSIYMDREGTGLQLGVFLSHTENWRQKVMTGGEGHVRPEDLKACQKYHKHVNLTQLMEERTEEIKARKEVALKERAERRAARAKAQMSWGKVRAGLMSAKNPDGKEMGRQNSGSMIEEANRKWKKMSLTIRRRASGLQVHPWEVSSEEENADTGSDKPVKEKKSSKADSEEKLCKTEVTKLSSPKPEEESQPRHQMQSEYHTSCHTTIKAEPLDKAETSAGFPVESVNPDTERSRVVLPDSPTSSTSSPSMPPSLDSVGRAVSNSSIGSGFSEGAPSISSMVSSLSGVSTGTVQRAKAAAPASSDSGKVTFTGKSGVISRSGSVHEHDTDALVFEKPPPRRVSRRRSAPVLMQNKRSARRDTESECDKGSLMGLLEDVVQHDPGVVEECLARLRKLHPETYERAIEGQTNREEKLERAIVVYQYMFVGVAVVVVLQLVLARVAQM